MKTDNALDEYTAQVPKPNPNWLINSYRNYVYNFYTDLANLIDDCINLN